jgi:hypothetical protein
MNLEPLISYLNARETRSPGWLAESFGVSLATPVMQANMEKLLDHHTLAGELSLKLVLNECRKPEGNRPRLILRRR